MNVFVLLIHLRLMLFKSQIVFFLTESVVFWLLSWPLSFPLERVLFFMDACVFAWTRACFLGRVLFFVDACVVPSCSLSFFLLEILAPGYIIG